MASSMNIPSLSTLPIELIYRLLDVLDTDTILFSFGHTCQRFYSIIQTYNQYKLNFKSVPKPYFHTICRLVHPENIISLTLSNDDRTPNQIKCFLSLLPIERLIRLRSLTLIKIDENDFHTMFSVEHAISSLSITFQNNTLRSLQTLPLLSSIISNPKLRHLDFHLSAHCINGLVWSDQCLLQSLIISNAIDFKQFSTILSHCLKLKKLVLQDCFVDEIDCSVAYSHLISLTFDDSELNMDECELLLSLTPALEHLHIVGGTNLSDGFRWENFIQKKLCKLNKFEFAFCGHIDVVLDDTIQTDSLIAPFRTPFWMEMKQWFVVCYYFKDSANYSLYSLPICKSNVRLYPRKNKLSYSTYSNLYNDISMTDNVHEMQLNLTNLMTEYGDDEKNTWTPYPYFRRLNKLLLCIDNEWPADSIAYLSTFIHLPYIVDLSISIDFDTEHVADKLTNITHLLQQTFNLHSLTIDSSQTNVEHICLLVPDHVKHLQVTVQHIDEMKFIIEHLTYLSSVTFELFNAIKCLSQEFLTWLMEKRGNSTYRNNDILFSIWFGRTNNQKN